MNHLGNSVKLISETLLQFIVYLQYCDFRYSSDNCLNHIVFKDYLANAFLGNAT